MSRKRYTAEQIIGMLREAEVRLSQGETVGVICRSLGISEQSYYRWRRWRGPFCAGRRTPTAALSGVCLAARIRRAFA